VSRNDLETIYNGAKRHFEAVDDVGEKEINFTLEGDQTIFVRTASDIWIAGESESKVGIESYFSIPVAYKDNEYVLSIHRYETKWGNAYRLKFLNHSVPLSLVVADTAITGQCVFDSQDAPDPDQSLVVSALHGIRRDQFESSTDLLYSSL